MYQESTSSRHPLRLVQPYDDDESVSGKPSKSLRSSVHSSSPTPRLPQNVGPLSSRFVPVAGRRELGSNAHLELQLPASQQKTKPSASATSLPSFSPRGPAQTDVTASLTSAHSSLASESFARPGQPTPSSADRLAALYQQYQASTENDNGISKAEAPRRPRHEKDFVPTPPPQPATSAAKRLQRFPSPPPRHDNPRETSADSLSSPARTSIEATSCPTYIEDSLSQTPHHHDDDAVSFSQGRQARRHDVSAVTHQMRPGVSTAAQQPSHAAATTTMSSMLRGTAVQPSRSTVALPAALSTSGVSGLMHTAVHTWAVLGFFDLRPDEGRRDAAVGSGEEDGSSVEPRHSPSAPSTPQDAEDFLLALEDYLHLFSADAASVSADAVAEHAAAMRCGLWRVLFNAVFYCVSVLDGHRRRRGLLPRSETEVCTGGPEDAYEVVFPSSSSLNDSDDEAQRDAPVRLTWRVRGETAEMLAARCSRDPLPTESPLWRCDWTRPGPTGGDDSDDAAPRRATSLTDLYGGRLRTALPILDWYFVLRCLAQVGYSRDAFFLQTPSCASPAELLLALLWLTQQYKLLAVAEYVELNRRYAFLLQFHVTEAFRRAPPKPTSVGALSAGLARARERLVDSFSNASVWPPVSFDENSTIQLRLAQLERCLGRPSSAETVEADLTHPSQGAASAGPLASTLRVRRLMAARRLISLSLNRLHHALQRQAEQAIHLGLHSPLDAQLSRKAHHDLYEEVMAGLAHVQAAEQRLQTAALSLAKAGSLVAFLLRYEDSVLPADEVLRALEEDDATWLDNAEDEKEGRGAALPSRSSVPAAAQQRAGAADRWRRAVRRGGLPDDATSALPTTATSLAQALSTFRATHTRATLTETWKRLLRRSHVATQTIAPENLRFLQDVEAQQIQEARVRENMHARYSLQAALAAELAVLGYERQQQRAQRSASHSPLRRADESVLSHRTAVTSVEAAPPVCVALPSMSLVTHAAGAFAQLRAEEAAYGSVALSTAELQLTEVGEPAAGSTTSARLELARLRAWEQELDTQLDVHAQTAARVAHCKKILEELYHQYALRMATPVIPRKAA